MQALQINNCRIAQDYISITEGGNLLNHISLHLPSKNDPEKHAEFH